VRTNRAGDSSDSESGVGDAADGGGDVALVLPFARSPPRARACRTRLGFAGKFVDIDKDVCLINDGLDESSSCWLAGDQSGDKEGSRSQPSAGGADDRRRRRRQACRPSSSRLQLRAIPGRARMGDPGRHRHPFFYGSLGRPRKRVTACHESVY